MTVHDNFQGVPIPIILRLFDDALQVCEEVFHQTSIDITEALQSHQDLNHQAKDDYGDKENSKSISKGISCHPVAELDILKKTDLIDAVDADDISWYFDGQKRGVDDGSPWGDFDIPGHVVISQGFQGISQQLRNLSHGQLRWKLQPPRCQR